MEPNNNFVSALVLQPKSEDSPRHLMPTGITEPIEILSDEEDVGPNGQIDFIPTDAQDATLFFPSDGKDATAKPKPARISGAMRKRLRFYLKKGLTPPVANRLAALPMTEGKRELVELLQSPNKQNCSEETSATPLQNKSERPMVPLDARSKPQTQQSAIFPEVAKITAASRDVASIRDLITEPIEIASDEEDLGPEGQSNFIPTDEADASLSSPSEAEDAAAKPKATKQSGAMRKRLRFYLMKGLDPTDANRLAALTMAEGKMEFAELLQGTNKPNRSEETSAAPLQNKPKREMGPPDRRPAASRDVDSTCADVGMGIPPDYSQTTWSTDQLDRRSTASRNVASTCLGVRMGIIPPDYPQTTWSAEQLAQIQNAILDRVRQLKKGSEKPSFNGCTFRPGWLSIACADLATAKWLEANLPAIQPWKDAKLKIVEDKEVSRPQIYIGYFSETPSTSNESILSLVEGQNLGLQVGDWRVLQRVQKGSKIELTIAMDPISAKSLDEREHRINYGFGKAKIHPKAKTAAKPQRTAAPIPIRKPSCLTNVKDKALPSLTPMPRAGIAQRAFRQSKGERMKERAAWPVVEAEKCRRAPKKFKTDHSSH